MPENLTRINVDTIEPSHRSGLLFSIYEGLKSGQGFSVVSADSLDYLQRELVTADVKNLKVELSALPKGMSEIKVIKTINKNTGCCGMCGG